MGELGIETQGVHRIVSFQVEQQVLRGVDDQADRVAAFAIALFAAVDGRPMPDLGAGEAKRRRAAGRTGTAKAGKPGTKGGPTTATMPRAGAESGAMPLRNPSAAKPAAGAASRSRRAPG